MRRLIAVLSFLFVIAAVACPLIGSTGDAPEPTVPLPPVPTVAAAVEPEPVTPSLPLPPPWTEEEVTVLAQMLWGEARGVKSITEQAACVWCVLNRVDEGYGSIVETVTAPRQFVGWQKNNPVDETLAALCEDVLSRWYAEKNGEANVGRVLPPDYTFFTGDGQRNHFRNAYIDGDVWDWSLQSPYEN